MQAIEIIVAWLHRQSATRHEHPAACLSPAERDRAARYRSDADRRRFVMAHAKLRSLLGERLGVPPAALRLTRAAQGKPLLADGRLQFSHARSAELAAYAFARGAAVGIDVEAIRPMAAPEALAARAFGRHERRAYAELAPRDKLAGFFTGWTRTEALAKALGLGLSAPPEALDAALEAGWVVRSFSPAPGFAGALAYHARALQ
jgi:4'-phosphopantetheinyl transferase